MTTLLQPSLSGGELAPSLHGRVDLARYQTSLKTCKNWITRPYGGAWNRTGTRFVAAATSIDGHTKLRLIPFQFNTEQGYVMEFGHCYMRVYMNGGQVQTNREFRSGDITYVIPQPFVLATPYTEDELDDLTFAQDADVMTLCHPNHPPMDLSRLAHDIWTLTAFPYIRGPWQDVNVDREAAVYASGTNGVVTLTASKAIFAAGNVGQLFYAEQREYLTPWEAGKAVEAGDIRRSDGKYYRALNSGKTGTYRPAHTEGTWSDGVVSWLYLHSGLGIARITAVAADGFSATATVLERIPDYLVATAASGTATATTAAKRSDGFISLGAPAHGIPILKVPVHAFMTLNYTIGGTARVFKGCVEIYAEDANTLCAYKLFDSLPNIADGVFAFTSGTVTAYAVKQEVPFAALGVQLFTNASLINVPSYRWRFGAWGGDQGFPSAVCYYDQRLAFACTSAKPSTLWMSRTGSRVDFGTSVPMVDDDAISGILAANQVNAIRGMIPLNRLVALTSGAEWTVGSGDKGLSAATMATSAQSWRGSSKLPPIGAGKDVLYVQDKGQSLRNLHYDSYDTWGGDDLSVQASHLLEGHSVVAWAWQQVPHSCAWIVRDDGVLLGMTYMREQEVVGWHRHDLGGAVESVAVVSEGAEDALYLAVRRAINGQTVRYIERLTSRADGVFLDSSLSYLGTARSCTSGVRVFSEKLSGKTFRWVIETGEPFFVALDTGKVASVTANGVATEYTISSVGNETRAYAGTYVDDNEVALPIELVGVTSVSLPAVPRSTFTGLGHLEGKYVAVVADGAYGGLIQVVSGSITLGSPASIVHAGLPIVADLETLDLAPASMEALLTRKKAIHEAKLLLGPSGGLKVGRDASHLMPVSVPEGLSGTTVPTSWGESGRLLIRQEKPFPAEVRAIIPEVAIGG
jgi:hypothetical protein